MKVLHPNLKVAYKILAISDMRMAGMRDNLLLFCEDVAGIEVQININPRDIDNYKPSQDYSSLWFIVTQKDQKAIVHKNEEVYIDQALIEKDELKADITQLKNKLTKAAVESIQKENKGPKDYDIQEQYIKTVIELRKTLEI